MELTAVIRGLQELRETCHVKIYSDSKYVVDAFRQKWIVSWQKNNWKNSQKKAVKNQDLWQELLEVVDKHEISWNWVKGHSGDPMNERADALAREAIDNI